MKKIVCILFLTTMGQAMAFQVSGANKGVRSVTDEQCDCISSAFRFDV